MFTDESDATTGDDNGADDAEGGIENGNLLALSSAAFNCTADGAEYVLTVAPAEGVTVRKIKGAMVFTSPLLSDLTGIQDAIMDANPSSMSSTAKALREAHALLQAAGITAKIKVKN